MLRLNRPPAFWGAGGVPAVALAPIAALWGRLAAWNMNRRPRVHAAVPVVAVGNFTSGGAGKTPTVAALVRIARAAGFSPAVLTRGYGGRLAGPLRVDPSRHAAADVGDEPLLHARLAPTIVARDRAAGLALVAGCGADLVLLDDGFQNPTLAKDLSLVVVDRGHGLGNGRVIPAGPLRAPLAAQLARADAVVQIDAGDPPAASLATLVAAAGRARVPLLGARLVPRDADRFAGRRVLAFAGIGRPEKFAATLAAAGAEVVELRAFPDHHPWVEADAEDLLARAAARGLDLVTTEKDAVRFAGHSSPALIRLERLTTIAAVDLVFDDEAAIRARLVALRRTSPL